MFGSFGLVELILILVIVLIVFGAGRLPQLGEGLGKAIKGFKRSTQEAETIEATADRIDEQAGRPAPPADTSGRDTCPGRGREPKPSDHRGSR